MWRNWLRVSLLVGIDCRQSDLSSVVPVCHAEPVEPAFTTIAEHAGDRRVEDSVHPQAADALNLVARDRLRYLPPIS